MVDIARRHTTPSPSSSSSSSLIQDMLDTETEKFQNEAKKRGDTPAEANTRAFFSARPTHTNNFQDKPINRDTILPPLSMPQSDSIRKKTLIEVVESPVTTLPTSTLDKKELGREQNRRATSDIGDTHVDESEDEDEEEEDSDDDGWGLPTLIPKNTGKIISSSSTPKLDAVSSTFQQKKTTLGFNRSSSSSPSFSNTDSITLSKITRRGGEQRVLATNKVVNQSHLGLKVAPVGSDSVGSVGSVGSIDLPNHSDSLSPSILPLNLPKLVDDDMRILLSKVQMPNFHLNFTLSHDTTSSQTETTNAPWKLTPQEREYVTAVLQSTSNEVQDHLSAAVRPHLHAVQSPWWTSPEISVASMASMQSTNTTNTADIINTTNTTKIPKTESASPTIGLDRFSLLNATPPRSWVLPSMPMFSKTISVVSSATETRTNESELRSSNLHAPNVTKATDVTDVADTTNVSNTTNATTPENWLKLPSIVDTLLSPLLKHPTFACEFMSFISSRVGSLLEPQIQRLSEINQPSLGNSSTGRTESSTFHLAVERKTAAILRGLSPLLPLHLADILLGYAHMIRVYDGDPFTAPWDAVTDFLHVSKVARGSAVVGTAQALDFLSRSHSKNSIKSMLGSKITSLVAKNIRIDSVSDVVSTFFSSSPWVSDSAPLALDKSTEDTFTSHKDSLLSQLLSASTLASTHKKEKNDHDDGNESLTVESLLSLLKKQKQTTSAETGMEASVETPHADDTLLNPTDFTIESVWHAAQVMLHPTLVIGALLHLQAIFLAAELDAVTRCVSLVQRAEGDIFYLPSTFPTLSYSEKITIIQRAYVRCTFHSSRLANTTKEVDSVALQRYLPAQTPTNVHEISPSPLEAIFALQHSISTSGETLRSEESSKNPTSVIGVGTQDSLGGVTADEFRIHTNLLAQLEQSTKGSVESKFRRSPVIGYLNGIEETDILYGRSSEDGSVPDELTRAFFATFQRRAIDQKLAFLLSFVNETRLYEQWNVGEGEKEAIQERGARKRHEESENRVGGNFSAAALPFSAFPSLPLNLQQEEMKAKAGLLGLHVKPGEEGAAGLPSTLTPWEKAFTESGIVGCCEGLLREWKVALTKKYSPGLLYNSTSHLK